MDRLATNAVGILVLLALLAAAGFQINHWRNKAEKLDVVEKEYASYKADREATDRTRRELAAEGVKDREELDAYRAKSNVRVVRVCNGPTVQVPAGTGSKDVQDQGGAGALPQGTRPDIGPSLTANVDTADEVNLELRMCRAYACAVKPETPECH